MKIFQPKSISYLNLGGDETEIMQDVARIQNYKIKIEEEYVEHVENEENFDDAYEQFMMSEGVFDCKSEVKKIKKGKIF